MVAPLLSSATRFLRRISQEKDCPMRRSIASVLLGVFAFAAPVLMATPARAGIDACGNIDVQADAHCEVKADIDCTGSCTPLNFTAACEGQCSGSCNVSASATCTGSCDIAGCTAQCNVDPGSFDCSATCQGSCSGDC